MTAESATEFSDYLTMETFFNAESAMGGNGPGSQQNYPNNTNQNPNTSDYMSMAPLENAYSYENSLGDQHHPSEKYEYHNNNNNNNMQYFYENSNSVQTQQQQSLISQHPSEFFVSKIFFDNFLKFL